MNIEQNRLATFSSIEGLPAPELAAAGFYATRNEREIQCYWCLQKVADWQMANDPLRAHKSDCPFILNPRISGNIPIASDIDFQDENMRLETYQNWPLTFITPAELAKAGFYYIHRSDQVKCAWCQGVIGQWEIGDEPIREHLKFFSACPKARSFEASPPPEAVSVTVPARLPKAMPFVPLEARKSSFENWQHTEIQNPDRLAEAGFYYLGNEDEVRCFHCDGGLRNWLTEDEPWREHARWFPKCPFLLLTMGHTFVSAVQAQNKGAKATIPRAPTLTLEEAMSGEAVQTCLQMGLGVGRIRALVKRKLDTTGNTFLTSQALAEAVLDDQIENECEDDHRPMRNTVTSLLWSAFQQSTASTSTAAAAPLTVSRAEIENIKENLDISAKLEEKDNDVTDPIELVNTNHDAKDLVEENKRLRDARECKICMNNEIGVVFIPCGHLVTCVQCAVACISCPICRADIEGQVRTFLV